MQVYNDLGSGWVATWKTDELIRADFGNRKPYAKIYFLYIYNHIDIFQSKCAVSCEVPM